MGKYTEEGEEASSSQQLSQENQARLRDISLILNEDIVNLIQKVNLIRDIWYLVDQEIPTSVKTALDTALHLDDHTGSINRASRNMSIRASAQQGFEVESQQIKELYSQVQLGKESLKALTPELKAMKLKKAELEAQLADLNTRIQAHEDKISSLSPSIEKAEAKIIPAARRIRQFKTQLSKISSTEEEDRKAFEVVDQIKKNAIAVINSFLDAQ